MAFVLGARQQQAEPAFGAHLEHGLGQQRAILHLAGVQLDVVELVDDLLDVSDARGLGEPAAELIVEGEHAGHVRQATLI
jgi:hypothetical protein